MARVLITGIAGFIGSSLAKHLLSAGHEIVGVDNLVTGSLENLNGIRQHIAFHCSDVRNQEAMQKYCAGVDTVFHQAALPSVPKSVLDPMSSHLANIDGTFNLLLAARDAGVRRVLYAASSSAYGESPTLPKREDMPTAPISPYAVQKLTGEHYMQSFARVYGMETVCLRYFNVFGPNQAADSPYSGVLAKFITTMLTGSTPTIYGDGSQSRDFTYIENVVNANVLAAEAPAEKVSGKVYNVACGENHTLLKTYQTLAEIIGYADQPIFSSSRNGDIQHSLADITKARADFGYSPSIGFKDGLRRTIAWYAGSLRMDVQLTSVAV